MAHKKGVGSTDNGRDSNPKYLGVKMFGGELAKAGNIIVRQRGTKYHAGENVYLGRDFTIHAQVAGTVAFNKRRNNRTYVSIIPDGSENGNGNGKNGGQTTTKKQSTEQHSVLEDVAETLGSAVGTVAATAQGIISSVTGKSEKDEKVGTSEKITLPSGKKFKVDDLKIVEGIGPKIEQLLHVDGIKTWQQLADADVDTLKSVLNAAGASFANHNPSTWSQQAQMCVDGKWEELEKWQDELHGGVDRSAQ